MVASCPRAPEEGMQSNSGIQRSGEIQGHFHRLLSLAGCPALLWSCCEFPILPNNSCAPNMLLYGIFPYILPLWHIMQKYGIMCAAIGCHDKAVLQSRIEYNVVLLISKMSLLWASKLPLHAPKTFRPGPRCTPLEALFNPHRRSLRQLDQALHPVP